METKNKKMLRQKMRYYIRKWRQIKDQDPLLSRKQQLVDEIGNWIQWCCSHIRRRTFVRLVGKAGLFLFLPFLTFNAAGQAKFNLPVWNPYNLNGLMNPIDYPGLVDLDGDGDYDILSASGYISNTNTFGFVYIENTGTTVSPVFSGLAINPFGLSLSSNIFCSRSAFGDLDNDGDLDMMLGDFSGIQYYENTGSMTSPVFTSPLSNPFNFQPQQQYHNLPTLVDLDDDSDLDLMLYNEDGIFYYYENTGSISTPNFSLPISYPFGLFDSSGSPNTFPYINWVDMDNDNDMDILASFNTHHMIPFGFYTKEEFLYFKNIGTSTNPLFAPPVYQPFHLDTSGIQHVNYIPMADMDADGDLDMMSFEYSGNNANTGVRYYENMQNQGGSLHIANIAIEPAHCVNGNDAKVNVLTSYGTGIISYIIGADSNQNGYFDSLSVGVYTLRVRDAQTIIDTSIIISGAPPIHIDTADTRIWNEDCHYPSSGIISVAMVPIWSYFLPLNYELQPLNIISQNNSWFDSLSAGNYVLKVTDAKGCQDSMNFTILPPNPVTTIVNVTPSSSSVANGSITLSSTGQGFFTYALQPVSGYQNTPGHFLNVGANTYTILSTDAYGCTSSDILTVGLTSTDDVNNARRNHTEVYPNPVGDELYIEANDKIQSASLVDLTGKVVLYSPLFSHSLPVRGIPAGVYFLKIEFADGTIVRKAIQKR